MILARQEAARLNSEFIGTEHLLLGIIRDGGGVAAKVFRDLNVDFNHVREEIEHLMTPSPNPPFTWGQLPFSPRAKRVLELSRAAAGPLERTVIDTGHLFVGLIEEGEGLAAQVLTNLGLQPAAVRDALEKVRASGETD